MSPEEEGEWVSGVTTACYVCLTVLLPLFLGSPLFHLLQETRFHFERFEMAEVEFFMKYDNINWNRYVVGDPNK